MTGETLREVGADFGGVYGADLEIVEGWGEGGRS